MPYRKIGTDDWKIGLSHAKIGEVAEEILTDWTLGGWLGSDHLGEIHYAGFSLVAVPTVFPLQTKGYKIIVYNRTDEKIGEISSEIEKPILNSCTFELIDKGCGSFDIELSKLPKELEDIGYYYRIDIHLFGDSSPWYSGYIIEKPAKGTTEKSWKLSGFGYYNQLDDISITREYKNKQITMIVRDIISTIIEPQTDIVYAANKIEGSSVVIGEEGIVWDHVKAKEVIKQLAELVLGYDYGVDAERKFFFRKEDTTIQQDAHWWTGKHLDTFIPKEDITKIFNVIHVFSGKVQENKSNYLGTVESEISQAIYGFKREINLTLPSILDDELAMDWGRYKLKEQAYEDYPPIDAKVTGIEVFKRKIEAKGRARISSKDGLHEYEFPIAKVKYKLSSDGLTVDVELGQKDVSFTAEQLALQQKIITMEQLEDARQRQS